MNSIKDTDTLLAAPVSVQRQAIISAAQEYDDVIKNGANRVVVPNHIPATPEFVAFLNHQTTGMESTKITVKQLTEDPKLTMFAESVRKHVDRIMGSKK